MKSLAKGLEQYPRTFQDHLPAHAPVCVNTADELVCQMLYHTAAARCLDGAPREGLKEKMPAVKSISPGRSFCQIRSEVPSPAHLVCTGISRCDRLRQQLRGTQREVDTLGRNRIRETGSVSQQRPILSADALPEKGVAAQTGNSGGIESHSRAAMRIPRSYKIQYALA